MSLAPAYDSLLIDPDTPSGGVAATIGKVFGGAWNAGTTATRYQFNVGGSSIPHENDVVCVSGANSGERCGRTIIETSVQRSCYNGSYTCTGFYYTGGSGHTTAGGDSGAPVYVMRSDGKVGARGIHIGGLIPVECTGTMHFPDQQCTSVGYAIGIHNLLDRWSATIETN